MIVFQTDTHEIDFSNLPITVTEKNDWFYDTISKSFSYPFNIELTTGLAEKLGMVTVNNIVNYKSKIYGTLILDNTFYDGYLTINRVIGTTAEVTLFYGTETLAVFDKKLSQLPFPIIYTVSDLKTFAKAQLSKSWPEATHNFPKIYRPDLKDEPDYENFNLFINNYTTNGVSYEFLENNKITIDDEEVILNRNIMAPMPYLLEVLKVAFKTEGLEMVGDFTTNNLIKKLVLVPQQYFNQYDVNSYLQYSFSTFTTQETISGNTINVYKQIHTPAEVGTYNLAMRVNFSNVLAKYFHLTVTQGTKTLYTAFSEGKEVVIETDIDININTADVDVDIVVELKLSYQDVSIANFNSFTYQFNEGKVNTFPTLYNLADFMPNLVFREFLNRIKKWFNLELSYTDNTVIINFLDNQFYQVNFNDHSHLEIPEPPRDLNQNNLFKITYPNDNVVMVDKDGQTYSDTDYTSSEIEDIDIEGLPLKVKENYAYITGVYPEDEEDIMLAIYDGLQENFNHTVDNIEGNTLSLQHIYNNYYKNWLKFRANAEIVTDTFLAHVSEDLPIKQGSFKYNKNNLIKSIERTRINEQWWNVKIESETL